ncbi:MAG: hypothetical protein DCE90_04215 [Pseudanabaena sp.]|nr:MAG: hypothetical protein DCE90_04215 [Pseudanabaena sp.]
MPLRLVKPKKRVVALRATTLFLSFCILTRLATELFFASAASPRLQKTILWFATEFISLL